MQEYIASRSLAIRDHRLMDADPILDSLRYRLLKEVNESFTLRGMTKDQIPLYIDHIIPRSLDRKMTYENLQVLCLKCNSSKQEEVKNIILNIFNNMEQCLCVIISY